jgi:hypothetical protein
VSKDVGPPAGSFDEKLAQPLIGRSRPVEITDEDPEGAVIDRRQVFGTVTVADRERGIGLRKTDGTEF